MGNAVLITDAPVDSSRSTGWMRWLAVQPARAIGGAFGLASLVIGLAVLTSLPVLQFLALGYLLESSARVARTGRLRDGVFGVRLAGRVGGMGLGAVVAVTPSWIVGSYARSAAIVDPGGAVARGWGIALFLAWSLTSLHVLIAFLRGGRLRHFLWPFGGPVWLWRRSRAPGLYAEARDGLWEFVGRFRCWHYLRLGAVAWLGTMAWIAPPSALIAATARYPLLSPLGLIWLACVAPIVPFAQTAYAAEGRASALFGMRAIRERYRHAPWAFAFALFVLLAASIPLYLLKIEMIPREAAWLPGLVFVTFLAPARLLVGWAHARSLRRERRSHWIFRLLGRAAIAVVAVVYVLVVFFSQYTSWGGAWSLFQQHAFLTPAPFVRFDR